MFQSVHRSLGEEKVSGFFFWQTRRRWLTIVSRMAAPCIAQPAAAPRL